MSILSTAQLLDRQYLGDGIYVGHDNFHIVLWLENTGAYGPDALALDPGTLDAFNKYIEYLSNRRE